MQKSVVCLMLSVVFLCGCTSIGLGSGKLSESEQLTVIDLARYTITRQNRKFVTAEEAAFINKEMPEVKIRYSGPREGKMTISWSIEEKTANMKNKILNVKSKIGNTKGKTVNFVYSGKFLTDSAMWRMGIVKQKYSKSKNTANPFRKRKKVEAADFDDLRKKDKIVGNKR